MIDPNTFRLEWAILEDRFSKRYTPEVAGRYYAFLSPRFSTAEFQRACAAVFSGREFFPRPWDFVEAVEPHPLADAMDQWALCQRVMEGERHVLARMSPQGQRVVALLGGAVDLGRTPLDSVGWIRKEFLRAYQDLAQAHDRYLPTSEVTPESRQIIVGLKALTGDVS